MMGVIYFVVLFVLFGCMFLFDWWFWLFFWCDVVFVVIVMVVGFIFFLFWDVVGIVNGIFF